MVLRNLRVGAEVISLILLMDSFIFWNIRGLYEPFKQFSIRKLLNANNVYLASILETKVRKHNIDRVLASIGDLEYLANYDHADNGWIWVVYDKQKVSVTCLETGNQFIHCRVVWTDSQNSCLITFVYAANHPDDRVPLWGEIKHLATSIDSPWAVVGDLNCNLFHDERIKNGEPVVYNVEELTDLVASTALSDLRYSGHYHTWCNKQQGAARLYCKLDRVFVNDR